MNKKETLLQLRQIYLDLLREYNKERSKPARQISGLVSPREHVFGATLSYVNNAIDEFEKLKR